MMTGASGASIFCIDELAFDLLHIPPIQLSHDPRDADVVDNRRLEVSGVMRGGASADTKEAGASKPSSHRLGIVVTLLRLTLEGTEPALRLPLSWGIMAEQVVNLADSL
jgi:hypothetical protein